MLEIKKESTRESYNEGVYEHMYGLYVDGIEVGGACVCTYDDFEDAGYIDRIDINEEHRGKGYGTAAIKELAAEYWNLYAAPDNEDAARLYAQLGEETCEDPWAGFDCGYGVYKF